MESTYIPPLLTLPRELRDEIYSYLVLPPHVFPSTSRPSPSTADKILKRDTFIDTRIFLPYRACPNLLQVCKLLRSEMLGYVVDMFNSSRPISKHEQESLWAQTRLLHTSEPHLEIEEFSERNKDDGRVRITLELLRPVAGRMGRPIPKREELSPRFRAFLPYLSQLKCIKFAVWPSWPWWKGPAEYRQLRASIPNRRAPQACQDAASPMTVPNPLDVALDIILEYLPHVDDIAMELLMHAGDYWNWDLSDNRREGIQTWLDSPLSSPDGRRWKRVYRRLVACEPTPPARSAMFYHKLESYKERVPDSVPSDGRKTFVHVSEGSDEVPEEWENFVQIETFSKTYIHGQE